VLMGDGDGGGGRMKGGAGGAGGGEGGEGGAGSRQTAASASKRLLKRRALAVSAGSPVTMSFVEKQRSAAVASSGVKDGCSARICAATPAV